MICKKIYVVLFILTIALSFSVSLYAKETMKGESNASISETVLIDVISEMKKEGVLLDHKKHVKEHNLNCIDCHHMFDSTVQQSPAPCVECHDFTEYKFIEGIRAPLIKTSYMKNIYHSLCKNCHKKIQRGGKPFPKKCSTCHPLRME